MKSWPQRQPSWNTTSRKRTVNQSIKEAIMSQPKIYVAKNGTKFVHYTKEKIVIQDPKNRTWATKGCK